MPHSHDFAATTKDEVVVLTDDLDGSRGCDRLETTDSHDGCTSKTGGNAYFITGTRGVLLLFGADTATFKVFTGEMMGCSPTAPGTLNGDVGDL